MHVLNDNFAHLGDIAITGSGRAILAGTSARSMSESAALEKEDIFIQIFDPTSDLSDRSAYFGGEERTGLSGGNGDKECTDHGVRWITKLDPDETIKNLHCVVTENNTVVLLYEKYRDFGTYEGVFYMFLDEDGNIIQEETMYRSLTHLQGGETPLCNGNTVWWLGNEGTDPILCLYSIIVQ